jgi:para-nitrobenzyl esterase
MASPIIILRPPLQMNILPAICCIALPFSLFGQLESDTPQAKTANGIVEGVSHSGISVFEGIPFAQPPVGDLRWREPQPVENWTGIRKTDRFGPNPMEHPAGDMVFRSHGMSEDCLYLNVWTPAKSPEEKLPVLVYFYGGGYVSGDGSEFRYDGESMARKGIVTLTVNYRLGVFGFLAHPALSKESPYHGSGDYGLLDQQAALRWVQENIAGFGGDPGKVTIAGESAGSISVCSQMASPLSRGLFIRAIGESGGCFMPTNVPIPLADAEQQGAKFATAIGATSLAALRALPADRLLAETTKPAPPKFPLTIDGHFFTKTPLQTFAAGEQAHVPLLAGWNSGEANYKRIMEKSVPTPQNYSAAITKLYGDKAQEALTLYPGSTEDEVIRSAGALGSDRFIIYSTWKWCDLQSKTGNPVYRYYYARPRPALRLTQDTTTASSAPGVSPSNQTPKTPNNTGAVHSAEIEYALGNLPTNRVYDWQPEDYAISSVMQAYFANFIITGNPNGTGLPTWIPLDKDGTGKVMVIDVNAHSEDIIDNRYHWLDQFYAPAGR